MTQPATSPFAAYRDLVSAAGLAYFDAERSASRIRWFEPLLVPGLLQTPDYTRALMTRVFGWDAVRTERMVALRAQLQRILDRPEVALDVVIDEAALRKVEDAQERWLEHLAGRPNISIRVIAGLHPGLAGPYVLADTPTGHVLHREDRDETRRLGAGEVGEWAARHERLREAAVDIREWER